MKTLFYSFLFISMLILTNGQQINSDEKILSVSNGVSFGFCRGYCRRSISLTSKSNQLIARKEPNFIQNGFPPVTKVSQYSSNEWNQLIKLIDSQTFRLLDDQIGCPDCADGGAEWIEIKWTNQNKRVTFEYGQLIKGFEQVIIQLRQLREKSTKDL